MWLIPYCYTLLFSFFVSLLFVRLSIKIAIKFNFMDNPSDRKAHTASIPLLGGLGIFMALTTTIFLNYFAIITLYEFDLLDTSVIMNKLYVHVPGMIRVKNKIMGIFLFGSFFFLIGLFDDKFGLSAKLKFILELLLAFLVVYFLDIKITLFVKNEFFSYAITILWIVGISNSFNLLDNMDGLCAGVGAITSIIFFFAAVSAGQIFIALFLIACAGTMIGFLKYNFPPARIFMGDAGSLFIGFIMSVLTILGTYYIKGSANLYPIFMPVLILGLPIYDTFSVIVIRLKNRESIFKADRNHFSHRLLRLGMSKSGVAWFIYLVTFCVAINSILLPRLDELGVAIIGIQTICILFIVTLLEYYGKINNKEEK